jgi:hypothetical protein
LTTGYKRGCHFFLFHLLPSNVLASLQLAVFFSFTFSTDPLCVMNFYNSAPTFHHVTTIWLDVCVCAQYGCSSLSSSTYSVITVMVTKTLYIYFTAVSAQGVVFYLRVTVARYRHDFQLSCPCGELNLLQPMTYFMYHQLYHSEILCYADNVFMCFAWI